MTTSNIENSPILGHAALATLALVAGASAVVLGASQHPGEVGIVACLSDADCARVAADNGGVALCLARQDADTNACRPGVAPPPSVDLAKAIALGRTDAAADVGWMRIVQFVGAPHAEFVRYAGIEHWVQLVNELAPTYRTPYFYGGILLATSPTRASVAEEILLNGATRLADDVRPWEWYLWLGFVRYFGLLDPLSAADAYDRSFELGGPPYLKGYGDDLRKDAMDCEVVWQRLKFTYEKAGDTSHGNLLDQRRGTEILSHCWEQLINAATATFRMEHKRVATSVDDLVKGGFLKVAPPAPPEQCWRLVDEKAQLAPCGGDPKP